jgi:hypothetical protein
MARDEDPTGGEVVAAVPLVIRGVPKEDTESGSGRQLVRSGGCSVRETRTPEDSEVVIPRRGTEKSVVWGGSWAGSGREAINKVSGGVKALSPKASRERRLEEKGAHGVVGGADHALSLAVLRGGVRTRHTQLDTVSEEESARGGVIKLTAIVALNSLNGEAELSGHPSEKVKNGGESIRLQTKRESPRVMRKIIDHHKIVFITRNTDYRRCP